MRSTIKLINVTITSHSYLFPACDKNAQDLEYEHRWTEKAYSIEREQHVQRPWGERGLGGFVELFCSRPIKMYITDDYSYKWIIDFLVTKKNDIILELAGVLKNEP